MSTLMGVEPIRFLWRHGRLEQMEHPCAPDAAVLAADSWLVSAGRVRGLELHRERFARACGDQLSTDGTFDARETVSGAPGLGRHDPTGFDGFWSAMVGALPRTGVWFPKVECLSDVIDQSGAGRGEPMLVFTLRHAPAQTRSVVVASHEGSDPRTAPLLKGPDLLALAQVRAGVQQRGAEEAIILSPDGFLVEGAYSALLWWQGTELCLPPARLDRIDSITSKTLVTLAKALGVSVQEEAVRPADLAGRELWAVSALHGIRIVTSWLDGPPLAEHPGRLAAWRARLDRLAHPIDTLAG